MTCTDAAPDHNNRLGTAALEAAQDDPIQHTEDKVTGPIMTHHTRNTAYHPQTAAHQVTTHRMAVDHIHNPSYRLLKYDSHQRGSCSLRSYSNQETQKSHLRRNRKVHIEEHPSDYYSSEDNSTDSGEESESLN